MCADSFKLKVVTPSGVALEEEVTSVSLPTTQGEIGVFPQHIDYNGLLGVGILSFTTTSNPENAPNSKANKVVMAGGFCQCGDGSLTVLADTVDFQDSIDTAKYDADRVELQKLIDHEDSQSTQWQMAKERLARIEAIDRLKLVS